VCDSTVHFWLSTQNKPAHKKLSYRQTSGAAVRTGSNIGGTDSNSNDDGGGGRHDHDHDDDYDNSYYCYRQSSPLVVRDPNHRPNRRFLRVPRWASSWERGWRWKNPLRRGRGRRRRMGAILLGGRATFGKGQRGEHARIWRRRILQNARAAGPTADQRSSHPPQKQSLAGKKRNTTINQWQWQ
jgi:hypothetical protein